MSFNLLYFTVPCVYCSVFVWFSSFPPEGLLLQSTHPELVNNDVSEVIGDLDDSDTDVDWDYSHELNVPQKRSNSRLWKGSKKPGKKRSERRQKVPLERDILLCKNCGETFKSRIRLNAHRLTCSDMDEHVLKYSSMGE